MGSIKKISNVASTLKTSSKIDVDELRSRPTEVVLKNVSFGYNSEDMVLHNIDLTINEPGLYCILGPNGVGKSTLIKCMSKIQIPTEGEIFLNGYNIRDMSYKDISSVIGYVPVSSQDVFSMSVTETILIGCHNCAGLDSTESKMKAVYHAMQLMQIEDLGNKSFNELSAGQHQKVAIARGLVQRPKIFILDEPTANLDVKYQVYVTELLRALAENENMIILMISHDLNISAKYAHKVIMMAKPGVIYGVGTPEEIITEENIEKVYGVGCKILRDDEFDYPIVILKQSIFNEFGRLD